MEQKRVSRRELLKIGAAAGAAALTGSLAGAGTANAQSNPKAKFKWRIQCHWPVGVGYYKLYYEGYCNRVREATAGEVDITPYAPDTIVPTRDTLGACGSGLLDLNYCWPAYWQGQMPVASLMCGHTFVWEDFSQMYWNTFMQEVMPIYRKAYDEQGVHLIALQGVDGITLWSKRPLRTLDDFKGLKVRSTGTPADTLKKAGCTPVFFPGSELYQALQTGVCDAAHWGATYTGYEMKFYEVTKYLVQPDLARVSNAEIIINKKLWEKLPKDIQRILEDCAMANNYGLYAYCDYMSKVDMDLFVKKHGGEISQLEPNTVKQLKKFSDEVLDEYAQKDPKYCGPVVKKYKEMFALIGR
jgi:TRAP-type mannitol/chloroaromatic compound transport system substrate-binding protein